MKVGILAAGSIARQMARTIRMMKENGEDVELYAIASREEEKAAQFAREEAVQKAYGSYEAMLADDQVELVYIASPHSHHAEHMKACIAHGKPILCEKAFTANAAQAEEVLNLAKQKNVFVTEAIWPRYMPSRGLIDELVRSGIIGEVRAVTGCLGYKIDHIPRIRLPELAGGALLDVGVYPITFASMVLGSQLKAVRGSAVLMETGVDLQDSITLEYPDGKAALLSATAAGVNDRVGCIIGTRGFIEVTNINNPEYLRVFHAENREKPIWEAPVPPQLTGYEYEVRACQRALSEGRLECEEMPHAETLRVMRVMDELRGQFGVRYPFE